MDAIRVLGIFSTVEGRLVGDLIPTPYPRGRLSSCFSGIALSSLQDAIAATFLTPFSPVPVGIVATIRLA